MKKFTAILLSVVLCFGLLAGCGKDYKAQESTVFILKNGKIVTTDVEEFSDTYDKTALETYINDTIKAYVDENGKDTVKLEELTVENNKATLIIEYASAQDYMNFNGIELFTGSVVEALAAGYSFDVDFASIDDGKATECTKDEIIDSSDLKVAIFTGACNVNVSGTILYASVEDTKLVDKETIAIAKGNNLLNKAVEETEAGTEAVQPTTEGIEGTEGTEIETEVPEGSVDSDDLLAESTQTDEVQFDFGDEAAAEDNQVYSGVYTYIIYK